MAGEVTQVAKKIAGVSDEECVVVLPDGNKARLVPVAASLIDDVMSLVKDPKVPMWHNPDKDRDEPNPSDPDYLQAYADQQHKRGLVAMDAMLMFGMELVDGLPKSAEWLRKLRTMAQRGLLDLSSYDLDDPVDQEFLYKRYVAGSSGVVAKISELSGVSPEAVAEAESSFQSNPQRR